MQRRYDPYWKGILEEVFDDFLRFVFPDADKLMNLAAGFEFLDKELGEMYPEPEKNGQTRYVEDECLGTQLIYKYNAISITAYTDEELERSDNPFALVLLIAKKALLKGKDRIFEEKLNHITQKKNTMGILEQVAEVRFEEGLKRGEKKATQKANRLFVENLLPETKHSLPKIASLANVSPAFVKKVKKDLASK